MVFLLCLLYIFHALKTNHIMDANTLYLGCAHNKPKGSSGILVSYVCNIGHQSTKAEDSRESRRQLSGMAGKGLY